MSTPSHDYTGRDNLEAMQEARRYNEYLLGLVRAAAHRGDELLDHGAGIGTFARVLARDGYSVTCIEPDGRLAAAIASEGLAVYPALSHLSTKFDAIYSFNVLEHIEDDVDALRQLHGSLKPGGLLLVYVPAFAVLFSSMDAKVGHRRRYTRGMLESKLRSAGFEPRVVRYADSLGFLAALAYRFFGSPSGDLGPKSVALYDRWVFPLSRVADKALSGLFGKNLFGIASKPA